MSEDSAPYEKAVVETAKATGKALDLVKDAAGPIADAYGLLIGDRISAARTRHLDQLLRRTKSILKERDLSETAEVAEQIAVPLLEHAQTEPRPEMLKLWATLLANAMDPSRQADVREEFVFTLQKLHPSDALVLNLMVEKHAHEPVVPGRLAEQLGLSISKVAVSLDHLSMHRCARQNSETYRVMPYGVELVKACTA